jgi:hypothetical protein
MERRWSCPPSCLKDHIIDWFFGVAEDFRLRPRRQKQPDEAVLCARLIDLAQRSDAAGGADCHLAARHRASLICPGAAHAVQEIPAG